MTLHGRKARGVSFDRIASAYRWLEYLALGPLLLRCRREFLPELGSVRRAVLFGDGDGRFTAALLGRNPHVQADAVDTSAAMLGLLAERSAAAGGRLRTHRVDALDFLPRGEPDLVVTHFFLDCLEQHEVETLVHRLTPRLAPRALWVISDFRVPTGWLRLPGWIYIRLLYGVFRVLTGLRPTRLPDHASALQAAGFERMRTKLRAGGLLTCELWQRNIERNGGSHHRIPPC